MTEHGISVRIQGTEGCATDPPLRSEFNVSNGTFGLWSHGDSSYSRCHASWELERHVDKVCMPDKRRRNLTGADITKIRRDIRRARRFLLKWEFTEAYELIDRIECALGDLSSSVARQMRAETSIRRHVTRAAIRSSEMLSVRECDILTLVGRGLSNKRIAQALIIAPETVKSHVKRIFIKLEVRTRAEAICRAGTQGLLRTGKSWT